MAGPLEVAALLHTGLIDQTAMAVRVFSARPYARSTFSHCDSRTLAADAPADKGWWGGRAPWNGILSHGAISRPRAIERAGALRLGLEQQPYQFGLPMSIGLAENSFEMYARVADRDADLVSRFGNAPSLSQ